MRLATSSLTAFATAMAAFFALASPAAAGGVQWRDVSVDEALAQAAQADTLVLLDVYATWCGPCQRLDNEVFPTDVVGDATADLVALKIDAEAGDGPAVAERFHVVGYPTVLLLRPDGTEIDRLFGFMPADEFAATVTGYRQGRGTIDELRARAAATPDDDPNALELALELGFRSAVRGEYDTATPLLERVIAEDPDNARGLRAQAHLALGKYMYLRGQSDYATALRHFEVLTSRFPETPEARDAAFQTAIAHARLGDEEATTAAFEGILADADDSSVYNSVAWTCFRENFQLERGIAIARRGLELNPEDASLWDTLAELQFAVGDRDAAMASIERARAIDPDEPYYQSQYERFRRD